MGESFKEFIDKVPDIIDKAERSPLGVASLCVIVLGTLAFLLFLGSTGKLKLLALAMIAGCFLGFVALVFMFANNPKLPTDPVTPTPHFEVMLPPTSGIGVMIRITNRSIFVAAKGAIVSLHFDNGWNRGERSVTSDSRCRPFYNSVDHEESGSYWFEADHSFECPLMNPGQTFDFDGDAEESPESVTVAIDYEGGSFKETFLAQPIRKGEPESEIMRIRYVPQPPGAK